MDEQTQPGDRRDDAGVSDLAAQLALERQHRLDADARATAALAVREHFLANVGHELRTPLNGLVGAAELALQLELSAEARDYVALMHRSALALTATINGILEITSLDRGQFELAEVDFDVRALIESVGDRYLPAARARGLALNLSMGGDAAPVVRGDPTRFAQIVSQLVDNAVRFTTQGSVTVRLLATSRPGHRCDLTVTVRDTGEGIRPEDLERVFGDFAQADDSLQRRHGGTGLGLPVCRRLAGRMGGTLGVSSVHGQGATFVLRVELPLGLPMISAEREPEIRSGASGTIERAMNRTAAPHVLLVEDNPVNRALATRMLEKAGCRVDLATDGAQAVELTGHRRYAAVFMDLQMPVMDGFEAARAIRTREGDGPRVPIIAVTAGAGSRDRAACADAGMDDYLQKPLRPADVAAAVTRWCLTAAGPA